MATHESPPPLHPPQTPHPPLHNDVFASSSPAFATPALPIQPVYHTKHPNISKPTTDISHRVDTPPLQQHRAAPILPILLPAVTLRPIAFRTFTKKHNLTLTSSALQALADFIGKHCGAGWREEGLAELVLEEVAKIWKKQDTSVIVDGDSSTLKNILKQLEGSMSGGRIMNVNSGKSLSRQSSFAAVVEDQPNLQRQQSFGVSSLELAGEDEEEDKIQNPRSWLKVLSAFDQPRMLYNASRKHFEKSKDSLSFFPPPSHKTELFRQRYHIIHQRLLRHDAFQVSSIAKQSTTSTVQQAWKITPIANLLGRSGTGHLLLGLLTISPTGTLAINDLTGSIYLDLDQANPIDQVETWLCPGMIVIVDGIYEEEYNPAGGALGNTGGIGGTIGGRFIGFQVGAPRCETRSTTLGIADSMTTKNGDINAIGGGFGWVDFLGFGSERAVGSRMRQLEQKSLRRSNDSLASNDGHKILILGEVNLDSPQTLLALRKIFAIYSQGNSSSTNESTPLAFVLFGNFIKHAAMAAGTEGSIEYKEYFDAFAALLSEFPDLLRTCTFIFVPGDNDPWPSAFSAGAATPLPRQSVPELFTNRIRRAFVSANSEVRNGPENVPGEAIWTSNPSRITLFGPVQELVLFRDDLSGRFRRNSIPLKSDMEEEPLENLQRSTCTAVDDQDDQEPMQIDSANQTKTRASNSEHTLTNSQKNARRITKTLLDQGNLSPFPLSTRPQHWSYATSSLSLYPLPSSVVLCDPEDGEAWSLVYQGCCVMNCGGVVVDSSNIGKRRARWIEYNAIEQRGTIRDCVM